MNTDTQLFPARVFWSHNKTKETKFLSICFKQVEHHGVAVQIPRDVDTLPGNFEVALRTLTEYKTGCVVTPTGADSCTVVSLKEHALTQNPEAVDYIAALVSRVSPAVIDLVFDDHNHLIDYALYRHDALFIAANGSGPSPDIRNDHRMMIVQQLIDNKQVQAYNAQREQYYYCSLTDDEHKSFLDEITTGPKIDIVLTGLKEAAKYRNSREFYHAVYEALNLNILPSDEITTIKERCLAIYQLAAKFFKLEERLHESLGAAVGAILTLRPELIDNLDEIKEKLKSKDGYSTTDPKTGKPLTYSVNV